MDNHDVGAYVPYMCRTCAENAPYMRRTCAEQAAPIRMLYLSLRFKADVTAGCMIGEVISAGAHGVVVGRAVWAASDPSEAALELRRELDALQENGDGDVS